MSHYEWVRSSGFSQFLPGQSSQFVNNYVLLSAVSAPGQDATLIRMLCDVHVSMCVDEANTPGVAVGWWTQQFMNVGMGRDAPAATPLALDYGSEDERITATGTLTPTVVNQDFSLPDWMCAHYALTLGVDSQGRRKVLTPGTTPKHNVTVENFAGATTFPDTGVWVVYYTCYVRALWLVP